MGATILVEDRDGFVVVTLNRPEKLNSFNDGMHLELRTVLDTVGADQGCRAILLTGAGRGFCAGQDLGDRDPSAAGGPPDLGVTIETFYNPLVRQIRSLRKPVICAVNGVAAGAGANIALACDIVLAAESAKFIQAFAKLGLVPDAGGTWQLTRLLGEARAKGLALTAQPLTAAQAEAWGLIWKMVPDDKLMDEATALAKTFANGPTAGYALIKEAVQAAPSNTLDEHLDLERDLQQQAGRTPDYAEGVRAFLEKRPPNFTGRT